MSAHLCCKGRMFLFSRYLSAELFRDMSPTLHKFHSHIHSYQSIHSLFNNHKSKCLNKHLFSSHRASSQMSQNTHQTNSSYKKVLPSSLPLGKNAPNTPPQQKVSPFLEIYRLLGDDIKQLSARIKENLTSESCTLNEISQYHFDGQGKAFRPSLIQLTSKACNSHVMMNKHKSNKCIEISSTMKDLQFIVSMVTEMIHTASLIHDDVVDKSPLRRGLPTIQKKWGQKRAVLAGDYIMGVATSLLAKIGSAEVINILTQTIQDLVTGELMQLQYDHDPSTQFDCYMTKTYLKTASLMANGCKAVAFLSDADEATVELSYQFGRKIGMAFQLIDDNLDFISTEVEAGKPTSADIEAGMATAPVLYASIQFPELQPMIARKFSQPSDPEHAKYLVKKSNGVAQAKLLAQSFCRDAVDQILKLHQSEERDALILLTELVLNRRK